LTDSFFLCIPIANSLAEVTCPTENGATTDANDMQTKKLTVASRSTSASFPLASASQPGIVIYDDNMKRSVSWPGPTTSKPCQSLEEAAGLESYVDNILDTKFLQQVLYSPFAAINYPSLNQRFFFFCIL